MGRVESLIEDMEYRDGVRAGKTGGFKSGTDINEDPYAHMTAEEKQAAITRARYRDLEDQQVEINKQASYDAQAARAEDYYAGLVQKRSEWYTQDQEKRAAEDANVERQNQLEAQKEARIIVENWHRKLPFFKRLFVKKPSSMTNAEVQEKLGQINSRKGR